MDGSDHTCYEHGLLAPRGTAQHTLLSLRPTGATRRAAAMRFPGSFIPGSACWRPLGIPASACPSGCLQPAPGKCFLHLLPACLPAWPDTACPALKQRPSKGARGSSSGHSQNLGASFLQVVKSALQMSFSAATPAVSGQRRCGSLWAAGATPRQAPPSRAAPLTQRQVLGGLRTECAGHLEQRGAAGGLHVLAAQQCRLRQHLDLCSRHRLLALHAHCRAGRARMAACWCVWHGLRCGGRTWSQARCEEMGPCGAHVCAQPSRCSTPRRRAQAAVGLKCT